MRGQLSAEPLGCRPLTASTAARPARRTYLTVRRRVEPPSHRSRAGVTPCLPAEVVAVGYGMAVKVVVQGRPVRSLPPPTPRELDHYVPWNALAARWAMWSPWAGVGSTEVVATPVKRREASDDYMAVEAPVPTDRSGTRGGWSC